MRLKTTLNVSTLGPLITRYLPTGYRAELAAESTAARVERAQRHLSDVIDGYEFYYPHSLTADNLPDVLSVLGSADVYAIAVSLHLDQRFMAGGLTSPRADTRRAAADTIKAGAELAGELGARLIIWPGTEGYDYPFQISYRQTWTQLLDGLASVATHCAGGGVELLLEYKPSQPATRILLGSMGTTLAVIAKLRALGLTNVKVNLDWQHAVQAGESLAQVAAIAAADSALGHLHANASSPVVDAKQIVGATGFIEALELAVELDEIGYGAAGGRIGFDIASGIEDPMQAARTSIANWRVIEAVGAAIDRDQLEKARSNRDALAALQIVYRTLGDAFGVDSPACTSTNER